jgi:hypothetical protein
MADTLSAKQQAGFEADGYLVLEGLLDAEECELLRAEVDHVIRRRAAGEQPMIVSYPRMALLTSHPPAMTPVQQLMGGEFAMHHIHASRHDAGQEGVPWHQDYEQYPQTNRSHLMVHVFYYLNGLNGEVGDLLLVPRSQHSVIARDALHIFENEDLPGSLTVDRLAAGSAVVVHSALFHARRAKPGGAGQPRYFIDISYCRNGILWPGYPRMEQINAKALEMGADRGGRYAFLYDGSHFFEQAPQRERLQRAAGSLVLELGE